MTQSEIILELKDVHLQFCDYLNALSDEEFVYSPGPNVWNTAQQADHILRSVKPLQQGIIIPIWILKIIFFKSNRPSKSYEELVGKYQNKLNEGAKASGKFIPPELNAENKEKLILNIQKTINKLCKSLQNCSENDFETLALPHPLLWKITLREMLYFTIHHVKQHHQICIKNLSNKP